MDSRKLSETYQSEAWGLDDFGVAWDISYRCPWAKLGKYRGVQEDYRGPFLGFCRKRFEKPIKPCTRKAQP